MDNHIYKYKYQSDRLTYWVCTNEIKTKCKVRCMSFGRTIRVKSSVVHEHAPTYQGDYTKPKKRPASLDTLLKNQQKMLQHQSHFQKSLDLLSNLFYNYWSGPGFDQDESTVSRASVEPISNNVNLFEPVDSVEQLNELDERLKDEAFMAKVVESMSFICGQNGNAMGIDCSYKLIDYFITRSFATQCSWTGNSREGAGKAPLKFYENFRTCFRRIVTLADSSFTETECDVFFKRVLRNSVKRSQSGALRLSKHKNRPKHLKYNVQQWKTPGGEEQQAADVLMDAGGRERNDETESYIKIDVDSETILDI